MVIKHKQQTSGGGEVWTTISFGMHSNFELLLEALIKRCLHFWMLLSHESLVCAYEPNLNLYF